MPNYLHRTTKQYLVSVSPISLLEPEANYIIDPDLSAVVSFGSQYWIITGDVVTLMILAERDVVDADALTASRDSVMAQLDGVEDILRALAMVMLEEINELRDQHQQLAPRTLAQLKTAMRNRLGS